jgi:enoyl-CoA hydratase/carnithine racemase
MTKKLLCDFAAPEIARELELAAAASAQIRTTVDFQEGLASFLEKRPPRWGDK